MTDTTGAVTVETPSTLTRTIAPIVVPKSQALLDRIGDDLQDARELEITSPKMAEIAQRFAGRFATVLTEIDNERLATTLPLREAQKWVNDGYGPAIVSIQSVVDLLKGRMIEWNREQRAKQKKAEDDARAEAAKVKAESDRMLAEAQARAQKLAAEAAELAAAGNAEAARLAREQAMQMQEAAEEARSNAAEVATLPAARVHGGTLKGGLKKWKGRVTDAQKLMLRCANDPSLQHLFVIDESALNLYANATKGLSALPGVEFYEDESIRVSKRPL